MPGQCCAAKHCANNRIKCNKGSFFRFPKDSVRAKTWAIAANREDLIEVIDTANQSYRMCSAHFEFHMFTNSFCNRLKHNAVPTLFPTIDGKARVCDHTYSRPPMQQIEVLPEKILQDVVLVTDDANTNRRDSTENIKNEKDDEIETVSSIIEEPNEEDINSPTQMNFEEVIETNIVKKKPITQTSNVGNSENKDILDFPCKNTIEADKDDKQNPLVKIAISYDDQIDIFFQSILAVAKTLNPANQALLQRYIRDIFIELRNKGLATTKS